MGIFMNIFFSVLAAGIMASLFENKNGITLLRILLIGIGAGVTASFIGIAGGWSDYVLFNFYNVLIGIGIAMMTITILKVAFIKRSKNQLTTAPVSINKTEITE